MHPVRHSVLQSEGTHAIALGLSAVHVLKAATHITGNDMLSLSSVVMIKTKMTVGLRVEEVSSPKEAL